ncbi:hypothetical protein LCGC14_1050150 [marine sediment metagenome]|uniref:Uncharacterized protein n=1 Tax=marine sediment metagenome TaxID=412755 RepID=A0A0F9MTL2_9ZZZZ
MSGEYYCQSCGASLTGLFHTCRGVSELLTPEEMESLRAFGLHGEQISMLHVEEIAQAQLAKAHKTMDEHNSEAISKAYFRGRADGQVIKEFQSGPDRKKIARVLMQQDNLNDDFFFDNRSVMVEAEETCQEYEIKADQISALFVRDRPEKCPTCGGQHMLYRKTKGIDCPTCFGKEGASITSSEVKEAKE